jgi:3-oxoacyl-[acyl-carrier-protein] synthase II
MKPLSIVGVGAISPLGQEATELLAALDAGRVAIAEADLSLLPGDPIRWAGRVLEFDYKRYIPAMKARRLDFASRMALAACRQALAHAGLDGEDGLESSLRDELGVMVGTASAGSGPLVTFLDALFKQSPEAAPPFEFPNTVANAAAGHVSLQLGLRGPNSTIAHSEAVIGQALLLGALMVEEERCNRLLVGAVDEWNPYYQAGYSQLGALRPARDGGGGMLLAEGAAFMVLEPPATAAARGVTPIATLLSVALGSTPGDSFRWVPSADRLAALARQAIRDAGLTPADIGSVMLAANGVDAMEAAEAAALAQLFPGRRLPASGIKGAIGERAVSGALSVAAAALARQRRQLPPFAGGALAPADWPDAVAPLTEPVPLPDGATLVLLYGSGGNFGAVILAD